MIEVHREFYDNILLFDMNSHTTWNK